MSTDVSFIGLGVMGFPMAGFLANGGHRVRVYNRTAATALKWVEQYGGEQLSSPALAAEHSEVRFFLCRQ